MKKSAYSAEVRRLELMKVGEQFSRAIEAFSKYELSRPGKLHTDYSDGIWRCKEQGDYILKNLYSEITGESTDQRGDMEAEYAER